MPDTVWHFVFIGNISNPRLIIKFGTNIVSIEKLGELYDSFYCQTRQTEKSYLLALILFRGLELSSLGYRNLSLK
jgi:hypothetical protein